MKKVLISGAGSGLGKALALNYAALDAEVCVSDMNAQAGKDVVELIEQAGGSAFFSPCDITQQADVDRLAEEIGVRWGALDILVNNAGIASAGLLEYESIEQWQSVLEINVIGHIRMSKAFVPLIKLSNTDGRAVINIASQAGITPAPGMGSYNVSKAAMVSFSETLFLEIADLGIHVSAVCPSFFKTNLDSSLRSDQPGAGDMVTKLIQSSNVSADSIAEQIIAGVAAKKSLIITHKDGRMAHRLKRFLPFDRYLSIMQKRTRSMMQKATSQKNG